VKKSFERPADSGGDRDSMALTLDGPQSAGARRASAVGSETSVRDWLLRIGGLAAIVGGLAWIVKGAAILATGDQPPVVFEIGVPLFALALVGLLQRLGDRGGRPARIGAVLAVLALLASLLAGALTLAVGDSVFVSVIAALAGVGTLLGLFFLGVATRRAQALPGRWRNLPLLLAVFAVPLILLAGGLLSLISERLLELPLVLVALAWALLGYAIWPGVRGKPTSTAPPAAR